MTYCPIQLKVNHQTLKNDINGAEYLLQVWNKKGKKTYEKQLKKPVAQWAIWNQYLVFKPSEGDDRPDVFHVVNLENNGTLHVPDFLGSAEFKHIGYFDGNFYGANSKEIKIMQAPHTAEAGGEADAEQSEPWTISSNIFDKEVNVEKRHTIHGLCLTKESESSKALLVALEEEIEHQIIYHNLVLVNWGSEYTLLPKCQPNKREPGPNMKVPPTQPIKVFYHIHTNIENHFAVALREDSKLDIYHNYVRTASPPFPMLDACLSFDHIYVRPGERGSPWMQISTSWLKAVNMGNAKRCDTSKLKLENIFHENIKNHAKIYTSFVLMNESIFLVHRNYVSVYDLLAGEGEEKWVKHYKFQSEITHAFRKCWFVEGEEEQKEEEKAEKGEIEEEKPMVQAFGLAAILKTGQVYFLEDKPEHVKNKQFFPPLRFKYDGEVVRVAEDSQNVEFQYIFLKVPSGQIELHLLVGDRKAKLNGIPNLDHKSRIISVLVPVKKFNQDFILVQTFKQEASQFRIFKITFNDKNKTINTKPHEFPNFTIPKMAGRAHSALTTDKRKFIILVDKYNMYRYNFDKTGAEALTISKHHNIAGMLYIDKYCYCLCRPFKAQRAAGLYFYNILKFVESDDANNYIVDESQVGTQCMVDFSRGNSRMVYQENYEELTIVPILNRNTINFIGMSDKDDYIAFKECRERFVALSKKGVIYSWNLKTGKFMSKNYIEDRNAYVDYECYEGDDFDMSYQSGYYSRILIQRIKPNEEPEDEEEKKFMGLGKLARRVAAAFTKKVKSMIKERKYHFKIIEIKNESTVQEHLEFDFDIYPDDGRRFFFTDDSPISGMVEVFGPQVNFYKNEGSGKQALFQNKRPLMYFQTDLLKGSNHPFLFSPCLSKYINLNKKDEYFEIIDINGDFRRPYARIPRHLMNLLTNEPSNLINRFSFITPDQLRIINKEGIEKIVDVTKDFEELEFNQIPCFDLKECDKNHWFTNRPKLTLSQTTERLTRTYQLYKSAKYLLHKESASELFSQVCAVDYNIQGAPQQVTINASFTYLNWKMIDRIDAGDDMLKSMDRDQIQQLMYNILPGGNTALHTIQRNYEALVQLFQSAHYDKDDPKKYHFLVPFIDNVKNENPIDVQPDSRAPDMILKYLQAYGADHHSKSISKNLPAFILNDASTSIGPYLASRLQSTEQLKRIGKGAVENEMATNTVWVNPDKLKEDLFAEEGTIQELKIEVLDIPGVHTYEGDVPENFFDALSETGNMNLFLIPSIQKLIEFKYPIVQQATIRVMFIPFLFFLMTFWFYSNIFYDIRNLTPTHEIIKIVIQGILFLFSCYFLRNEVKQMISERLAYLTSIWNYIDTVPPLLIFVNIAIDHLDMYFDVDVHTERALQAICTFFMWLKFLYFLRIFKNTGYLIKMIIAVIYDMRHFMLVLMVAVCAFGDTFYSISMGNPAGSEDRFITNFIGALIYSYRMALGDWDTGAFGSVAVTVIWIFFLLSTVFNLIVMMNLLIAIISETFALVNSEAEQTSYQEMAKMISENNYLLGDAVKARWCKPGHYLFLCGEPDPEEAVIDDPVQGALEKLQIKVKENETYMKDQFTAVSKSLEDITNALLAIKKHHGIKEPEKEKEGE